MSVSPSRQRILSLWLDRLPTDRLLRLSPDLASPIVIHGKRGNADVIVASDTDAERLGLRRGLALAQARAMHPALNAMPEDAGADAALLDQIADWCLRYTPLVACDPPHGLLLDIGGCAHLYGGERQLGADLSMRLARTRLSHRIVIAGTIGAAWAASRHGKSGIYASGKERDLLAWLPLSALRIAPQIVAAMGRVGLKRIGQIVDMPRAPLAARFGEHVLRQLDRAMGREHEPLTPRLSVAPYVAEKRFHEPIAVEEDVLFVTEQLARRLQSMMEARGDGARRLELNLFRTDGAVRRVSAGTSRPLLDPLEIRSLFNERLAALTDAYDPGFGFDMVRLSVMEAAPHAPAQIGFGHDEDADELDRLVDHLSARLGTERVRYLISHNSHFPEIEIATAPAQAQRAAGWEDFRSHDAEGGRGPRPLRLLAHPEPIDAIAEIPDGPPRQFRWRRALHEIVAAQGPERIESAWWEDGSARARDYFRVEDASGLRFWVFRAGLYRDFGPGANAPRWFMHGMFA